MADAQKGIATTYHSIRLLPQSLIVAREGIRITGPIEHLSFLTSDNVTAVSLISVSVQVGKIKKAYLFK